MPGLLEPISSTNIKLSDEVQKTLRTAGYSMTTFDELATLMTGFLTAKAQIESISTRLNNLTAENIPSGASAYGLKSGSVEASKLATKKATITRAGDQLTYSFEDIIKGVPAEMTFVSGTVTVDASGGRVGDRGNTGQVTLPSGSAMAQLQANIQTGKGVISLNKAILVPTEDGTTDITLDVQDFTNSATELNTSEHLAILSAEVAALKQKING